jgi:2-dehydro-3-deoxyphosphogluconate aldolase / (4S)-4-hydroxy-2-oxoglutarate aldolase
MKIPFESGIVAILRTKSEAEAREMASALVSAGINLIEFTTTTPGALDLVEEFSHNKSIYVGLGTCLTKKHVKAGKKAGAKFIISPHSDKDVIKATKAADLISIPGVASPTDIGNAIKHGADALKFFPASSLGPNYLKAVREPFPGQIWMATGGISVDSVKDWIAAGCTAVGLGGPLTSGGINEIANRVKSFQEAIRSAR